MILTDVWGLYKADKQIQGYSPQTLKAYYVQFNLLVNSFGNISIQELSTNSLKVYLGKAAEKLKPSSKKICYSLPLLVGSGICPLDCRYLLYSPVD